MISIILPTYNEAQNILPLIQAIDRLIKQPHEIIVVDDDSPDGTSKIVSAYIKKNRSKQIRLETRLSDHGLTKSIQQGIDKARGDVIVWMDCDFSHPPSLIPQLIQKIKQGYDIAMGSRYIRGGKAKVVKPGISESSSAIIMSFLLNKACVFLFGHRITDYTSGFMAVKRKVVETIGLRGDYGEYFIDFIVRAKRSGYKIVEVPYISDPRRFGESKTGGNFFLLLRRGYKYIMIIIKLLYGKAHS